MRILIVLRTQIPVVKYGGTERVMWYLGQELTRMGHQVTYLAKTGSSCPFARVLHIDVNRSLAEQLPHDVDVIHFNDIVPEGFIPVPYIVTYHCNFLGHHLDRNAVFVSHNHAERYGSTQYVYNGMNWDDYGQPDLHLPRTHFHFLGQVAWSQKNARGAIQIVDQLQGEQLMLMGGNRLNFKHGFRFFFSRKAHFMGMVGGEKKFDILKHSKGLLFPVLWYEPFGIAITESLYFGAPVFGTTYGSLPELVSPEVGFLSNKASDIVAKIRSSYDFSPLTCHQYAADLFNAKVMANAYLGKYEIVLNGKFLNATSPTEIIPDRKHLPWGK